MEITIPVAAVRHVLRSQSWRPISTRWRPEPWSAWHKGAAVSCSRSYDCADPAGLRMHLAEWTPAYQPPDPLMKESNHAMR